MLLIYLAFKEIEIIYTPGQKLFIYILRHNVIISYTIHYFGLSDIYCYH